MVDRKLDGMKVAILVTNNFEQVEMTEPRRALEDAGAQTMVLSPQAGQVQGFNHDQKADTFNVEMRLDQANPDDFDAVLLPGGALNADKLRMVPEAQNFVRRFDVDGKPIAAICHAPWLLVSADLVGGRTLTSYYTLQDDIRNAGGNWQDREVVYDDNWVTSRNPKDIPAFNRAMIDLFSQNLEKNQNMAQSVMGAGEGNQPGGSPGRPGGGQGRVDHVGGRESTPPPIRTLPGTPASTARCLGARATAAKMATMITAAPS